MTGTGWEDVYGMQCEQRCIISHAPYGEGWRPVDVANGGGEENISGGVKDKYKIGTPYCPL